jgi:superfamily II DNA or RNA helicase
MGLLRWAAEGCKNWEDFKGRFEGLGEKKKGDLFEELTQAFLLLDPEYATKLKRVWLHREVPEEIRKRLKLPAEDKGIDLIAETKAGEFWAIQCKYREDARQSLSWREVSTFTGLAFGVCRGIAFGLICSTTERITHVLKNQDNIGFCALDVWQGLDAEFFARLRAALGLKAAKIRPLKPRPHQVRAIRDAQEYFVGKKKRRGKMIMPCGTGKSLAAYWIAQKLGAKKIIVAVPSLALIRQTLKVWLRESMARGQDVDWICVCSDESAGRIGQDDMAVLRQDLGVPCLTDPGEIAAWLGKAKKGLTVVFTTYQSGEAIAKAAKKAKVRFELGIMDEAHKTVGAVDKLFSHLLHEKNLPVRRRLFMTATERRYQGESDQILSMDDVGIYGDTFHLLNFKRALECKPAILSDYKIVTILVSREEVAEMVRKNVFVRPDKGKWGKEIEAEMLAALVALRKAMKKHPIRHAVSFHGSIRRAEVFRDHNDAFNRAFGAYGKVESFHVSGQTPTGTRARIINDFAGTKLGLITNARCLTEGVDVPDIDCVLFADPRKSAVDIVQAVGRALRPVPGKKMGYVIVPILHDEGAKPEDIFDTIEFKEVLTTLRALAANDDRIIEYFRAISQGKRRAEGRGGSVEFEMDERLAKRIDLEQFVRDIELKCWSRLAKLSWRPFDEARKYVGKLKIKNAQEWFAYSNNRLLGKRPRPSDIPSNPWGVYVNSGWKNLGDWLNTGTISPRLRRYRPFRVARAYIRKLKLKNGSEWRAFCKSELPGKGKLPPDIPNVPSLVYSEKGWTGMGDWLGTGRVADRLKQYRSFFEARKFVRILNLKNQHEWRAFCKGQMAGKGKLPSDIPIVPSLVYADKGWKGMGDWLGTGNVATFLRKYRSFREARRFVRSLELKSASEWRAFCKRRRPSDIPAVPYQVYANKGWKNFGDWLGTGKIATSSRRYRPFHDARTFARSMNLKNVSEWRAFCKGLVHGKERLPSDIPANPWQTYKGKGWKGCGDWLGTGRKRRTNDSK